MAITHFSIIPVFLLAISFSGYNYDKEKVLLYHNDAEIISMDNSMRPCNVNDPCNCPGGYFIHIDGIPDPHGKCIGCTSFKAMKFPDGFSISNATFPLAVSIDWQYDALSCDSSRIIISSIKKRE